MSTPRFSFSPDQLRNMAADVLAEAKSQGATSAEMEISEGVGLSVSVRKGEVETIEHNRDKGVSVTVYIGQR
jgi:PmbA protein